MGFVEVREAPSIGLSCLGLSPTTACSIELGAVWTVAALLPLATALLLPGSKVFRFLVTVRALALKPTLSPRLANCVRSRDYTEDEFFRAVGAEIGWV